MPIITEIKIQEKNKKRCNLFIDGEFFSSISLETTLKNNLKKGQEVDQKELSILIEESNKVEALSKAVDYVSKALKTKRQVKDYLIKKGYTEEIAWYCVDKLKEYDYINDEKYSERFIESTSKTQGRKLVEYKLMMKGVRKEDIALAYENVEVDNKENAKNIAEKYLKNKEKTKENLAKAYRYLIGKGFSYEEASFALSQFNGDN